MLEETRKLGECLVTSRTFEWPYVGGVQIIIVLAKKLVPKVAVDECWPPRALCSEVVELDQIDNSTAVAGFKVDNHTTVCGEQTRVAAQITLNIGFVVCELVLL